MNAALRPCDHPGRQSSRADLAGEVFPFGRAVAPTQIRDATVQSGRGRPRNVADVKAFLRTRQVVRGRTLGRTALRDRGWNDFRNRFRGFSLRRIPLALAAGSLNLPREGTTECATGFW